MYLIASLTFLRMHRHIAARPSPTGPDRTSPLEDGEHAAKATKRRTHDIIWENGVRTYVSISLASTPSGSEYETEFGNEIKEAYYTLIEMGGRPTREIQLDPGLPDPVEAQRGLRHYSTFWENQLTFKHELDRWKKFRDHQQKARERPKEFPAYCQFVRDYRRENGMDGEVDSHLQWDQQTKLDEWKEYQFFQHRELARPRARIERWIEQAHRRAQGQLDAGGWSLGGSAEHDIHSFTLDLKELDDLWEWVERQLQDITSETATSSTGNKTNSRFGQTQLDTAKVPENPSLVRSRTLRSHTASGVSISGSNESSKASGRKRKQPITRSILSPVDPSRVSKAAGKKPARQTRIVSSDVSQPAKKVTIDQSNPQRSSKQVSELKNNIPVRGLESTSLGPIHSSRVSKTRRKAGGPQPTEMRVNITKSPRITNRHRNKRGKSSAPSAGARPAQQPTPADTSPRRISPRILKKPERFCPG